jgi:hypothetical protein
MNMEIARKCMQQDYMDVGMADKRTLSPVWENACMEIARKCMHDNMEIFLLSL